MDSWEEYLEFGTMKWEKEIYREVNEFINDFPVSSIKNMTINEYCAAPSGMGQDNSFCRRLRYGLAHLCSMGNVFPDVFGIYYRGGTELCLSKTFKNDFGSDYEGAFECIKDNILRLFEDFKKKDHQAIERNPLNSSFKHKLLSVYFNSEYLPCCANNILNEYCKAVGLSISSSVPFSQRDLELVKYMKQYEPFNNMSNFAMMTCCDHYWRLKQVYNLALNNKAGESANQPKAAIEPTEMTLRIDKTIGSEVKHAKLGIGKIHNYTSDCVVVDFNGDKKRMAYSAFKAMLSVKDPGTAQVIRTLDNNREKNSKVFETIINDYIVWRNSNE